MCLTDVLSCLESVLGLLAEIECVFPQSMRQEYFDLLDLILATTNTVEESIELQLRHHHEEVEKNQLVFLMDCGFKVEEMALLLSCSKRTVERKLQSHGLSQRNFTLISDNQLDEVVAQISSNFPSCGEKMMRSRLQCQGILVQRERVRQSLRRVDPLGVERRLRRVLRRRRYHVECPNALWHVDGYHKLIRWKLVVHGAVDGYSRLIMFLKVSTNNRAASVLSAFLTAVNEFGLPSRIRTDRGGENVLIAEYMINHPQRGPNRASVITGKSTHNQRIERLWRDLFSGCVCFFYYFFYFLEDSELLNINDEKDLYTLQYVFVPIIQRQLDVFRQAWSRHSLRTERGKSPMQLWIMGLQAQNQLNSVHPAVLGTTEVRYS